MIPQGEKSYLKTTKKGNVTINPRKEDLMSESFRRLIQNNLLDLKEAAKKKDKQTKAKRWWDDDGDGIGYEPHEVKKEACDSTEASTTSPTSQDAMDAKKEKMKQKMLQQTEQFDAQRNGKLPT